MNNLFASFIIEMFNRLVTAKPAFMKYAQFIVLALGAVTGLPDWLAAFHIIVPLAWQGLESQVISIGSIGFAIGTQLTTNKGAATVTADGKVMQTTDPKKLPFTEKMEVKSAQDKQVPNSSLTLAEIKK